MKYEYKSIREEDAKCKLSFHIDMGAILGTIPLYVCKEVGLDKYDPIYQNGTISKICRKYEDEETKNQPF